MRIDNSKWNFYREGSNHAYTSGGEPSYGRNCSNNLIISQRDFVSLEDVQNSFIFCDEKSSQIYPVSEMKRAIHLAREIIPKESIIYHIPKNILRVEKLPKIALRNIAAQIKKSFGIGLTELHSPSENYNSGVYFVSDDKNMKYVLRNIGRNPDHLEELASISNSIPNFFPRVKQVLDKVPRTHSIKIGEDFYSLESFEESDSTINVDSQPKLVGKIMAKLHNSLNEVFHNNPNLIRYFSKSRGFNESSLFSMYLDLDRSSFEHGCLLSKLERIIGLNKGQNFEKLSLGAIHGDLNTSNILSKNGSPKIIDLENLAYTERIKEFSPALLFRGKQRVRYKEGSVEDVVNAYQQESQKPLTEEELSLLPEFLIISTIKSYLTKNLRRSLLNENYLMETKGILSRIEGDNKK